MPNRNLSSPPSIAEFRRRLARHVAGEGLELGPGHEPFPVPYPGVTVRYVDRWKPADFQELFPEIDDVSKYPEPDVLSNLDKERLASVGDDSQDFVIASHVLEHVAEPLGLLVDIHRVLRPGGVVLILLPDRRRTFDSKRAPTSLNHLVAEHDAGVDEVDEEHLLEFLMKTDTPFTSEPSDARAEEFNRLRERSIHVHCWQEEEFFEVLVHTTANMGLRWELLDAVVSDDRGPGGFEFGYVLRKSTLDMRAPVLGERLAAVWSTWHEQHRVELDEKEALRTDLEILRGHTSELEAVVAHHERRLALVRKTPPYLMFRAFQQARRRFARDREGEATFRCDVNEIVVRLRRQLSAGIRAAMLAQDALEQHKPEQDHSQHDASRSKLPLGAPSGHDVFDNYLHDAPSAQSTLDIFEGEWASQMPPPHETLRAGASPLFADERISWLVDRLGGIRGQRVLELGPLEGGHTYMLEQAGADSVVAVEANVRAYLRCLIAKELLSITRAQFLCGDFVEWLRATDEPFDLCVASGVLYHMRNPVELIELIAKRAGSVFLWTHYFDREALEGGSPMATNFAETIPAERDGFPHVLHRQVYGPALEAGFCGGNERYSMWLERDGVMGALRHYGFDRIEVGFDEPNHPNGPSLGLVARRA